MCHQHHQWNELVCLKQNQVCIHCPSCLEHFSSTKRGRKRKKVEEVKEEEEEEVGVKEGRDCSEGGNAGKTTSGRAGISPFTGIWLVFPLCKNDQKTKTKKSKWCSKNKDERGRGFLLGCFVGCFLFHKATLGFDAVVVVWGLAAATGFWLGAFLHVGLSHTPPGGEVEGDTPLPRESPVPLHAVPLQLRHKEPTISPSHWNPLRKGEGLSERSPVQF